MNKTGYATIKVRASRAQHMGLYDNIPPRSRLYGLLPCGMETVWSESLTSYINRLGHRHGVCARTLAAQEIGPLLASASWWRYPSPQLMGVFCASRAMRLNGPGNPAATWSTLLEQLTQRTDLHLLTTPWWIGDLPQARNLRPSPAWCPACYEQWKRQGLPIYQPLLWMLRVVTVCPDHQRRLVQRCPGCQGKQAFFLSHKARLGECTKCAHWLGEDCSPPDALDGELLNWQQWVVSVLQEQRRVSLASGVLSWQAFFLSLTSGIQKRYSRLARLTGIDRNVLYAWIRGKVSPSIEMIFKFCYACDTTPLQIMANPLASLEQALQDRGASRPPFHRRSSRQRFDREKCLNFLQSVLDGGEGVLSVHQVARRLRRPQVFLRAHFPLECEQIAQQYHEYRRQRREEHLKSVCEAVRKATLTLHAQGIPPTRRKVEALLADSEWIYMPEARRTWQAARQELGLLP